MKYVNQMDANDFYKLHLFMFPAERIKQKSIFIHPTVDKNYMEVIYEEYISPKKTEKVAYRFADFWPPHAIPFRENDEMQRLYFTYMIKHFGKSYVDDFLKFHTGLSFEEFCKAGM